MTDINTAQRILEKAELEALRAYADASTLLWRGFKEAQAKLKALDTQLPCTCTWPGDGSELVGCTRQTHPWRKGVDQLTEYVRSLPLHLKPAAFRITEFPEGYLPSIGDAHRVLGLDNFATVLDGDAT